jgi:hypothetical protein
LKDLAERQRAELSRATYEKLAKAAYPTSGRRTSTDAPGLAGTNTPPGSCPGPRLDLCDLALLARPTTLRSGKHRALRRVRAIAGC